MCTSASSSTCRSTAGSRPTAPSCRPASCSSASTRSYAVEAVAGPFGLGPARYYRVPGARGTIGFIAGVSDHFCAGCNRLRLMSDGRLKTCLFSAPERELDVRPLLSRPAALAAAIDAAIDGKNFDRLVEAPDSGRGMSQIGG